METTLFSSNMWYRTNIIENRSAPQFKPHRANLTFLVFWRFFARNWQNRSFWTKKWLFLKEPKNYLEFFFHNECEMSQIQSETDSNLKISNIGKFVDISEFCFVFEGNRWKELLWKKRGALRISLDMTEFFWSNQWNGTNIVFHLKLSNIQLI